VGVLHNWPVMVGVVTMGDGRMVKKLEHLVSLNFLVSAPLPACLNPARFL